MIISSLVRALAEAAADKVILVFLSPSNFSQNKVAGFDWRQFSKSTKMLNINTRIFFGVKIMSTVEDFLT